MSVCPEIYIPNTFDLQQLDAYQHQFNIECAAAFKWVYRLQGWTAKKLEKQIVGITASTWQAYGQPSYGKNRSLHVLALFSWLSQISMTAIYYGNNIQNYWQSLNKEIINVIAYAGMLSTSQFKALINVFLPKYESLISSQQYTEFKNEIDLKLKQLDFYIDNNFLFPKDLDVEKFKYDYYRSIALVLKEWRQEKGLSKEIMSMVVGETLDRYRDYENPHKVVPINMYAAMRLKLGFKINDTVPFTKYMEIYPGLTVSRTIQQLREEIITQLMNVFKPYDQKKAVQFVKSYYRFY